MSAGGRSGTENFKSYADVQAALDREYVAQQAGAAGQSAEGAAARNWWYEQQIISSRAAAAPSGGGGGGGGGSPAAPVPAPPPAPILPKFNPMTSSSTNFKVAPSDIIQFDDSSVEIALITDLLFEDIGATELANISRSDLIDGTEVIYAPIKNLPTIRRDYDPRNVIATSTSDYFSRFAIDLSSRGVIEPYFDAYGNLVVEIETVEDGEDIQVQILSNGTIDLVEII
jgi:hypothetical protein